MILDGVSTNGASPVLLQLGDSEGAEITGYSDSATAITGVNACAVASYTTGFAVLGSTAGAARSGILTIANLASNTWVASGTFNELGSGSAGHTQGSKTLSTTLDRVRLTTVNGTDTFDGGTVNITYEG